MAFGGNEDNDSEVMSEINMTPLVDVMLVLLIIFMITVPVLSHSVKLDLPRERNVPNLVKPQTVTISVTADGGLHWNAVPVDAATLASRLQGAAGLEPQPEVHIHGDRNARYEEVLGAMAAAQRAGILKLGFVTDPTPR